MVYEIFTLLPFLPLSAGNNFVGEPSVLYVDMYPSWQVSVRLNSTNTCLMKLWIILYLFFFFALVVNKFTFDVNVGDFVCERGS